MHWVYILYSKVRDRYYTGETEDLETRLLQHNEHFYEQSSTSPASDWSIVRSIAVENRSNARKVERYIKSMKSRKYLIALCDDEDFFQKFRQTMREKFAIEVLG